MYDKELVFIDSIMDVLMPEILLVEEEIKTASKEAGAEELTDRLEHKLCVWLTREASASSEAQQRLEGKSLDAKKMIGFLKISCSQYLALKSFLENEEIFHAYYDTRIGGRGDANVYKLFTCLNLLRYMVTKLDATEVQIAIEAEEAEAQKALDILGATPQHLSDLHTMISARIRDGILSGSEVSVAEVLVPLTSLRTIPDILFCGFELRQAAKKKLSDIIAIADICLKKEEQAHSPQSGFRRGIYQHIRDETEKILSALYIAYPNDATLTPVVVEKELESGVIAFPLERAGSVLRGEKEEEEAVVDRDTNKENKKEIDCFLNGIKAQPRPVFMLSYSRCVKELTKRHEIFAQQYNAASDNKAMLIQQFIKDALIIIESKMNESSAVIGNSRDALLKLQKDFLETIKTIHQSSVSASSRSSNSPPLSLFFRQVSRIDAGDKVAAKGVITFRNAGSEE